MYRHTGICECISEPRGERGLEGYALKDTYQYEFVPLIAIPAQSYYRVWPVTGQDYYETCSVQAFQKYFKEIPHPHNKGEA